MSIIDVLIYVIDWIFQNAILKLLPDSNGDFTLVELQQGLDSFEALVISGFSGYGAFAPMSLILLVVTIALSAEFGLFVFHIILKGLKWAHIIG